MRQTLDPSSDAFIAILTPSSSLVCGSAGRPRRTSLCGLWTSGCSARPRRPTRRGGRSKRPPRPKKGVPFHNADRKSTRRLVKAREL
eukprot:4024800-Pleurochrysis_carterae.AAC.2